MSGDKYVRENNAIKAQSKQIHIEIFVLFSKSFMHLTDLDLKVFPFDQDFIFLKVNRPLSKNLRSL